MRVDYSSKHWGKLQSCDLSSLTVGMLVVPFGTLGAIEAFVGLAAVVVAVAVACFEISILNFFLINQYFMPIA